MRLLCEDDTAGLSGSWMFVALELGSIQHGARGEGRSGCGACGGRCVWAGGMRLHQKIEARYPGRPVEAGYAGWTVC